jgi:hypothetical protein
MSEDDVKQFLIAEMGICVESHEELARQMNKEFVAEFFFLVIKDMYKAETIDSSSAILPVYTVSQTKTAEEV